MEFLFWNVLEKDIKMNTSLNQSLQNLANDAIIHEAVFAFSKAKSALDDWRALPIALSRLNELIAMDYAIFKAEAEDEVKDKLFRVVAYCDTHARDKEKYNEYSDKRALAY